MRYPLLRIITILSPLVCVPALLPAAPVPRAAQTLVYYFPTQSGTKWSYDKNGGDGFSMDMVVTAAKEKDGHYFVTVEHTTPKYSQAIWLTQYLVSRDGVFKVWLRLSNEKPEEADEWDPPACMLKLPHSDGNTWQTEGDRLRNRKTVAARIETVTVPAGTFRAIRVESGDYVHWYAPSAGLVKVKDGSITYEMKSFELPKK